MTYQQAQRRFTATMMIAMAIFLAASFAIARMANMAALPGWALWLMSLVPIATLLFALWAHWRFINQLDEFLRSIQIKAILLGLAVVMSLASSWGYLEAYADAAALPLLWINPIYWIAYSAGVIYFTRRDGGAL